MANCSSLTSPISLPVSSGHHAEKVYDYAPPLGGSGNSVTVRSETIPAGMKERPQWVLWKLVVRGGNAKKLPYQVDGASAKVNDPQTWNTFDATHEQYKQGGYSGLGYVFASDDPFCGLDLDGCRDPATGLIADWAKEIILAADGTYAEVSPSGTGVKAIVQARWPGEKTGKRKPVKNVPRVSEKEPGIEIYDQRRYFAMTGQRLTGCLEPEPRQDLIDGLKRRFWPGEARRSQSSVSGNGEAHAPDADKVAARARKYLATMPGAISGQGGHDATYRVACVLCCGFGLSEDDALPIFLEWNDKCEPPWLEHELRHKLNGAANESGERSYMLNGKRKKVHTDATSDDGPSFDESESIPFDGKPETLAVSSDLSLPASGRRKPRIQSTDENLPMHTAAAWSAITLANEPPQLFRFGGRPARIIRGDDGEPAIALLDLHSARSIIADAAEWFKHKRVGEDTREVSAYPPDKAVHSVLATPEPPLPILTRIVEAPVFARDGSLLTEPGYHPASRTFFAPAPGFVVPDVPLAPTTDDIARAVGLITVDLFGDFPFTGEAERAHAAALLVQPFCRDIINGATPLYLFEKPAPGTGATLATDMATYPATGRPLAAMTEGRSEDEWRKRLTAKLKEGPAFFFLDNLRGRLDSAALSAAITSAVWEDRILGVSQNVRIAVKCAWLATGNNPAISNEISRRTVRIRLDAKVDEPWLRTGYRHPDLRGWARENRSRLVWAALVLIRAWIVEGQPQFEGRKLGMFESWSETIGGILAVAGIPGFLANLEDFYRDADDETAGWRQFIAQWWEEYGTAEVTSKELWELTADTDPPCHVGDGSEQSKRSRFGRAIARMRDRVFSVAVLADEAYGQQGQVTNHFRLDRTGTKQSASTWKLTPLNQ